MEKSAKQSGIRPNYLVLSDLHLGEEMLPGSGADRRRAVAMAEAAFVEFLRYHQRFRVDGRPWRLVVNGDLFDFMSLFVGPAEGVAVHGHDERRLGAGRRLDAAVVRMRIIGDRYRGVLAQMMRFAGAGHRIDIVAGNHDQELAWPEVWDELRRALVEACPAGVDAGVALGRIALARWFVYEPGVAWIEHGHQYDDACAWEFGLAPADPRTGELATNVDYAALRHLSSAAPEVDTHGTEEWSLGGYLRYALGEGLGAAMRYVTSYLRFVTTLVRARRAHRSVRTRLARAAEHDRALDRVAAETGVARAALDHIDGLARAPVTKSTRRLARMLRLDRMAVCALTGLVALAAIVALPAWAGVLVAAAAVAGAYRGIELLGPAPAVQAAMPYIPARIRAAVDAPFVVFGHTHEPLDLAVDGGGRYVNAGTWLPAIRPGLLRAFTHVAILRDAADGVRAELRQWKDGQSKRFIERERDGERGRDPTPVPRPAAVPAVPIPVLEPGSTAVPGGLPASGATSGPAPVALAVAEVASGPVIEAVPDADSGPVEVVDEPSAPGVAA